MAKNRESIEIFHFEDCWALDFNKNKPEKRFNESDASFKKREDAYKKFQNLHSWRLKKKQTSEACLKSLEKGSKKSTASQQAYFDRCVSILEQRSKRLLNGSRDLLRVFALNANKECQEYMGSPVLLGIKSQEELGRSLVASYYIGATWLIPGKYAAVVQPRIPNLDLDEIYQTALSINSFHEEDYFSKCYGIDFGSEPIEMESSMVSITPLMMLHYLSLLQKLVKVGLKKGYVRQENNLNAKVKGKILISKNIKQNIFSNRKDRTFCSYQIFTADIPENRLLKKALLFVSHFAKRNKSFSSKVRSEINGLLQKFTDVSDEISINQVKKSAKNKIFKNYPDACRLARMILQRYGYSISNIHSENKTYKVPPYWIDLSRLFELYVYSSLNKAYPGQIRFQVNGSSGTVADYIKIKTDQQAGLIIDAKFKPGYNTENDNSKEDSIQLSDVRELCGYARDEKLLKTMGYMNLDGAPPPIVNCLVVYPYNKGFIPGGGSGEMKDHCLECEFVDESVFARLGMVDLTKKEGLKGVFSRLMKVKGFVNFYKVAILLPCK